LAKPEVTGLVLTLNGAKHLDACLASLDFCDRILVVDSGSTDATQDIAAARKARVLVNPWPGPRKQFEFAFTHITTPWVVSLDQDEILSDELRASVIHALQDPADMSAFLCPPHVLLFRPLPAPQRLVPGPAAPRLQTGRYGRACFWPALWV